jgi:hypothetical protein
VRNGSPGAKTTCADTDPGVALVSAKSTEPP